MKILIGYDGAAASDAALRDLERAGLPDKADALILVAVPSVPPPGVFAVDPTGAGWLANAYVPAGPTPQQMETARETGEHAARLLRAKFREWTVEAETAVGSPAETLLEKAETWKADLIVVGSRGWTWMGRTFIGSTAQKVMNHAKADVRLANPHPDDASTGVRILIAVDGSRDSRLALDAILRRNWPQGTRVRLIAAKETFPWAEALAEAGSKEAGKKPPRGTWSEMEKVLDAAEVRLKQRGLEADWEIHEGDPRRVILAEAEAFRADCIFLGRRGLSGFNRLLLGSVSSAVASHAPCSVEISRKAARVRNVVVRVRKSWKSQTR